MYETHFRLRERPFSSMPRPDLYFPAASIEQAHHTLARCVERSEGPALLIGGPGLGKSLVCQMLAERFQKAFRVVVLNSAQLCTRRALLQHLLYGLELPCRGLEEGELRLSLLEFLQRDSSARPGVLVIVDEAHTLPVRLFEDLRMITNVVREGQPSVRLVLAGGPLLEERFAHPKLECFNQRLAARCYLQPLNYDEVCAYVRSQVAKAGAAPDEVFAPDAWLAIHHASGGIPRLINQVCDHALLLTRNAGQPVVDARRIEEAWADLQQLPAPFQPAAEPLAAVVEFGDLPALNHDPAPAAAAPAAPAARASRDPAADDDLGVTDRLDEIQQRLHELAAEDPAAAAAVSDPPPPAMCDSTPRSDPGDPFAERFDQEEPVVDHYAALQAGSASDTAYLQRREMNAAIHDIFQPADDGGSPEQPAGVAAAAEPPAPASAAEPLGTADVPDRELAQQAAPHESETPLTEGQLEAAAQPAPPCESSQAEDEEDEELERQYQALSELSFDLPDPPAGQGEAGLRLEREEHDPGRVQVIRTPPPDDNDMIVVLDEQHGQRPLRPAAVASHRQEYRQLFSRLRNS